MLIDGHLYDTQGEWIGWVEPDGAVFSVVGAYVGQLSRDFRVLRKRAVEDATALAHRRLPSRPAARVTLPSVIPLSPLLAEIGFDTLDVFEEMPERLHTLDADPAAKDIGE